MKFLSPSLFFFSQQYTSEAKEILKCQCTLLSFHQHTDLPLLGKIQFHFISFLSRVFHKQMNGDILFLKSLSEQIVHASIAINTIKGSEDTHPIPTQIFKILSTFQHPFLQQLILQPAFTLSLKSGHDQERIRKYAPT